MPTKLVDLKAKTAPHDMIVWKKCLVSSRLRWVKVIENWIEIDKFCLVKLLVKKGTEIRLNGASSINWTGDDDFKCRAAKALVLGFYPLKGKNKSRMKKYGAVFSSYDKQFLYEKGKTVKPEWKFSKTKKVCDSGIHFFQKREQAAGYNL